MLEKFAQKTPGTWNTHDLLKAPTAGGNAARALDRRSRELSAYQKVRNAGLALFGLMSVGLGAVASLPLPQKEAASPGHAMAHEIPKLKISELQFGQHFQRFLTLHPKLRDFFAKMPPKERVVHLQCFYRALLKEGVSFDDQAAVLQALASEKIIEKAYSKENLDSAPADLLRMRTEYINALGGLDV